MQLLNYQYQFKPFFQFTGRKFGIMPGNWYGPSTVAHIMQNAVKEAEEKHTKLKQIAVYVAVDCTGIVSKHFDVSYWQYKGES